jgi:HEAT repeat protein
MAALGFGASAWNVLNDGLKQKDPEHRKNTVISLGTIATPPAVALIERTLKTDKSGIVRQAAAVTLGDIQAKHAIPALKAALDDTLEVSFAAARSLEILGDPSGRHILEDVVRGDRPFQPGFIHRQVRKAKQKLHKPAELGFMGAKAATGAFLGPASMSITLAEMAMKDGVPAGRLAAIETLAKIPDPQVLPVLEEALNDKNWAVRATLARALGERGNRETQEKLTPLLDDSRDLVRKMAAASIIKLSATNVAQSPKGGGVRSEIAREH